MKPIKVPEPKNVKSILDGFDLMGIDTDPETNLVLALVSFKQLGIELKAIIQTDKGYVLLTYKEPK